MNQYPHIILETANFHGGNIDDIKTAITNFADIDYQNKGIKFHAFKYDKVMLPDFSWFDIIKNFFIDPQQWRQLITLSVEKGFKVWLDLFCIYGVETLEQNLDMVHGIKFQPSILDNLEIVDALKKPDLQDKELILNISGLEVSEIERYLQNFASFNFKKVILQLGFQNYPTQIEDTSLKKLDVLKSAFPDKALSYADHIDAELPFARRFPVYAFLKGCTYLEKHICNGREETEYDFNSALEVDEVKEMAGEIRQATACFTSDFISENECKYYEKTLQKPVLKTPLKAGQLVAASDLIFRRTDKPGLNSKELKAHQENLYILNRSVEVHEPLTLKDFKKPRVAAIVAARMKSSRLKKKAILPINGMSSIERCLDNCLKFPFVDDVVLATSTTEEDAILGEYTLKGKAKFWQGDPEDVISRYLGACEEYGIDVIIRVTGDCPCISPEIAEYLLRSHFESGADFTDPRNFAVGSNSQIYNVQALKRVIELVGKADYSEHMTLYMTNNPQLFKVNYVDLPEELIRDYRLTLDYREDLDMFNALYKKLEDQKLDSTLVNIIEVLDANPDIPKMNAHKTLVYKTDKELIKLLNEKTTIKI
ncbi:MAG: NTP transferase domain-containing protein [bacterium]|nr:NTP transferase domain-containing protein [bacterium]